MQYSREYSGAYNPLTKVHYRPIEAAIRWSGLAPHERRILAALQEKVIPEPGDFPDWPALRLNTERIYDAILNEELPYAVDGITVHDRSGIEHPNLTVRHVHLKSWMNRYYPEQRPDFLFSWIEQIAHPTITIDAVHALVLDRDTLRAQIEQRDQQIQALRDQIKKINARTPSDTRDEALSARSETTYLHIIGGLLTLLLGRGPSGRPYSSFRTQESVISTLMAHHGDRLGITQRTLETKFAAAKRKLSLN
jgi:hypothetical protein